MVGWSGVSEAVFQQRAKGRPRRLVQCRCACVAGSGCACVARLGAVAQEKKGFVCRCLGGREGRLAFSSSFHSGEH